MPEDIVGLDGCATRIVDGARVEAARAQLLPAEELNGLAQLFRLLGDVTRARLLYALLEAGELCVCDLSAATSTPRPMSPTRFACCERPAS